MDIRHERDFGSEVDRDPTSSMLDRLALYADRIPDAPAIEHYDSALRQVESIDYAGLVRRIGVRAAALGERLGAGDAAMVALDFGPEYVISLLAIQLLGAVAIPAMPATRRSADRLGSMLRVGRPRLVIHEGLNTFAAEAMAGRKDVLVDLSDLDPSPRLLTWGRPKQGDAALLQFTSGSTAQPKGVALTHGNIVANQQAIARQFGHSHGVRLLGWLPLFHDMGLIGNVFQPLYCGGVAIMIAPSDVIARPASWLELIEKTAAQTSGGPNFIYDLCVKHVSEAQAAKLDLSGWMTAYNGSEPVRAHTMDQFARRFAPSGLSPSALLACYGMAEASLLVCGQRYAAGPSDAPPPMRHVPCGPSQTETLALVVDPETMQPMIDGQEGEIVIAGPSVASRYRTETGDDEGPFSHRIAGRGDAKFFKTGDCGFIRQGRLHVVGRFKDAIKIRGETHHPEDLETIAERECELIEAHSACVIGVASDDGEEIVVLVEVARSQSPRDRDLIFRRVRSAFSALGGVSLSRVVFVQRAALSRTSSGKFLRWRCRERYRSGDLPIFQVLTAEPGRLDPMPLATPGDDRA